MRSEIWEPTPHKTPASSGSTVTFLVLLSAMLIGSTGGILIADRQASIEQQVGAAAKPIEPLIDQAATNGPAVGKRKGPRDAESGTKQSPEALESVPLSVGAIRYSEQPDSASVDIELGPTVLVATDKARNPERIYFDLRDSQRPESPAEAFRGGKTVWTDGTLVSRVTLSEWESGAVRIVLDTSGPCNYTYEIASAPSPRLLVTVQPQSTGEIASQR